MDKIELTPGKCYLYQGHRICIRRVLDLTMLLGEYEATGVLVSIPINALKPLSTEIAQQPDAPAGEDLLFIKDEAWAKAQHKLSILQPILERRGDLQLVDATAEKHSISQSTLYRWLRAYDETRSVRSLVELPPTGGKGKKRLSTEVDAIIQQAIETHYLTPQKKPVAKVILAIRQQCRNANITPPGDNTVRRRIRQISEEEKTRRRWSKRIAREQFEPLEGKGPKADAPLEVFEIDHTPVDLILVDEVNRQPLGRPWLTMVIDNYSRMVAGFYLSFDPPGAIGTGLCMAHAILPKELWLSRLDVQGEWPCWGVPSVLHSDNAKELRGDMLARACEKYGVHQEWRPVATPHWGGHIERLMGTFMQEVQTLPGTTFSNARDRKDYDSAGNASLTLREFERWLTTFIINVYHRRVHQGINEIPYERYQRGIFGTPNQPGTGLPERLFNELQVRLDFMPREVRTVQEYGVLIDHVHYYADVLKPYINTLEPGSPKSRIKRKFTFKRDPRDISCLYFFDPATQQYHRIPYRDTSHPAISIWEFRKAVELARLKGMENLDEGAIFDAYDQMRTIELAAIERTKKATKSSNRIRQGAPVSEVSVFFQDGDAPDTSTKALPEARGVAAGTPPAVADLPPPPSGRAKLLITAFDDLDDDASFT